MKPFTMNIEDTLLIELRCAGMSPDDVVLFMGQQVIAMQSVEPNYTKKNNNKRMKFEHDFWIMRGFYPGTSTMFKIVVADATNNFFAPPQTEPNRREQFHAKITHPPIKIAGYPRRPRDYVTQVDSKLWNSIANDKMNNILVDDTTEPKINIQQRTPKCMSPKGVKIYNLDLKGSKIDKK